MELVLGEVLAQVPLFAEASVGELDALSGRLHERRLDAGDALMREGEPGTCFALLVEGQVAITRAAGLEEERLAVAGPGSVLGELALLRREPRGATVTALRPCVTLTGDADDLAALLEVAGVHERVRRLVSSRLAADALPVAVAARADTVCFRPLVPADRGAISTAIDSMSPITLRRRFFSSAHPSDKLIDHLVNIDYVDHFAWFVFDPSEHDAGVGVARYIRDVDHADVAEAAFTVLDPYQGRGIGTVQLGALATAAQLAGITTFSAAMLNDNDAMRGVFDKAEARYGFSEPGVISVRVDTAAAAALLPAADRHALESSARDIVTAAGLALAH